MPSSFKNITDVNTAFSAQDINENCMCDCAALYLITHKQFWWLLAWWTLTSTLTFLFLRPVLLFQSAILCFWNTVKKLLSTITNDLPDLTDLRPLSFVMLDITAMYVKRPVFFSTHLHMSTPIIWNLVILPTQKVIVTVTEAYGRLKWLR